MFKKVGKNQNLIQILLFLLILAVGSYVLGLFWVAISQFMDIIVILLVSWLLSFLLDPIVDSIQKYLKFSKVAAASVTYLLLAILIVAAGFVYIPLISTQIVVMVRVVPELLSSAPAILNNLNYSFFSQLENTIAFIPSIAQFLFSAFMVLILSFYFIIDQKKINQEIFNLVPNNWHESLEYIEKVINDTFISFFRVQIFYGVSTALITWAVLYLFGSGFTISVAFLAGVFTIIPLIGPFLAIILPILVTLLISPLNALLVGIILFLFQQVIFNIIGPKLLGKAFKLHPAIILISLLIGLKFGGILGAIFAIPVLGIGVEMVRKFGQRIVGAIDKKSTELE